MHLFLAHGMGRSPAMLAPLARKLGADGHTCHRFGYRVMKDPLDVIAGRYAEFIRNRVPAGEPFGLVGHSLGNIIGRLATPQLPEGLARVVMFAPPNSSPTLARLFGDVALFKFLTRDAGQRLASPGFYETLPIAPVPTLVIAGDAGPRATWLPFKGEPSDSVVAIEETKLAGAEHRVTRALHTFIVNDPQAVTWAREFLRPASA